MEMDEALDRAGGYRPYHLAIFICLGLSLSMPLGFQDMIIVFLGYSPPHHCKVPANQTLENVIPLDKHMEPRKCEMYVLGNSTFGNDTMTCIDGWDFSSNGYSTIVTEWDLVCSNNYLAEMAQVIFHCLCLVADITMSFLIDRLGRRPVHIASSLLVVASGTGVAFSVNYTMFIVLRAVTGFFVTACVASSFTLLMELFDSKRRPVAGIACEFCWVGVYLLLGLLAWAIRDWRHLQLTVSLTGVVWIIYIWVLPESVPWLVATGKYDRAEETLRMMAKWNRKPQREYVLRRKDEPLLKQNGEKAELDNDKSDASPDEGARDVTLKETLVLVTDPKLRIHLIISSMLWFCDWIVYYCLVLASPSLGGDRFLNYTIMGLVEIPAYLSAIFLVVKIGRRIPTFLYHLAAGVPLVAVVFIPNKTESGVDLTPLITTLFMVAKFAITSSFAIMVLYTKELFPTHLRGTSNGVMTMVGRLGMIIAPIVTYAAKADLAWVPSVVMAVISILVGSSVLFLPETAGKQLAQTVEDVHNLYRKAAPPADPNRNDEKGQYSMADTKETKA